MSNSRDTDGLRRLTCVTDGCSVNQTKALDRVADETTHSCYYYSVSISTEYRSI